MTRSRRFRRIAGVIVICYIAICAGLVRAERHLLYLPYPGPVTPQEAGVSNYQRAIFPSFDDSEIPFWEHAEAENTPILLYFHGNGGGLYAFKKPLQFFASHHLAVVAMEYRGYPGAPSKPSQHAIVGDAVALYDMIKKRYPHRPIQVWGYSLGSGVAIQLAAQRPVQAVVLEAPFTSTADRAAQLFPLFPVHLLMQDQYRSSKIISDIHSPLMIIHGDADTVIPEPMGESLFNKAAEPKIFHHYPIAGHLNLITTPAYEDAVKFLHNLPHMPDDSDGD